MKKSGFHCFAKYCELSCCVIVFIRLDSKYILTFIHFHNTWYTIKYKASKYFPSISKLLIASIYLSFGLKLVSLETDLELLWLEWTHLARACREDRLGAARPLAFQYLTSRMRTECLL